MKVVDLRSDTLTRPTAGMSRAMAEAQVGDNGVERFAFEKSTGVFNVWRRMDFMAVVCQHDFHELAHARLVINDKYAMFNAHSSYPAAMS